MVFDKLLGEGTCALLAGFLDVGDVDGAGEAARVYTGVFPEVFVFNGNQAIHQYRRHVFKFDQHPVLFVRGVDAGDAQRVEALQHFFFEGGEVLYVRDFVFVKADLHFPRWARAVPEGEGLGVVFDGVAVAAVLFDVAEVRHFAVIEQAQFVDEVVGGEGRAAIDFQRAGIDARRDAPQRAIQGAVIEVVFFFQLERVHKEQHAAKDADDDQEIEGVTDEAQQGGSPVSGLDGDRRGDGRVALVVLQRDVAVLVGVDGRRVAQRQRRQRVGFAG